MTAGMHWMTSRIGLIATSRRLMHTPSAGGRRYWDPPSKKCSRVRAEPHALRLGEPTGEGRRRSR